MALTATTYGPLLKRRYTKAKVEELMFSDRPLLAQIGKDTGWSGESMTIPVIHGAPQGIAASTLAQAQTSATNLKSKRFLVEIAELFGVVEISNKVMLMSRDQPGAFISSKTAEIDTLYDQQADVIHQLLWGNGGGAIGRRASLAGNVITLSDPSTVFAFEEGMFLSASANDGSDTAHALRAGTNPVVTVVNRAEGKITVDNAALITAFADNDYLFRTGDFYGNTGTNLLKGVQAYIVASDSSVPDLWSMVRSSDPQRLAGCRVAAADLSGLSIEERIKLLGSRMNGRYKMKLPTVGYLNPEDWQTLEIALNSRGIRALDDPGTAKFGFQKLICMMGGAAVPIYADRGCPKGTFFGFRMENWKLWSMLELIHVVEGDGLTMLRKATSNDYEYRLETFAQLTNNAPGFNGRVPLT